MNHFNIHIQRYEVDSDIILADISTVVNTTDRIALVGPNGVGKSTFLKILSGQIREYIGGIDNTGGISIGYLEQIHFLDEARTVRDDIADAYTDIRDIEARIRTEEANLENGEYEVYTELLEKYKYIGGYTYMNEVEKVARGIGIYDLLEKTLAQVSGGERTKIALCKTLLSRPDFLLLDEPTNFIDLKWVEWLEKYLSETWKGGYIIVSHDREFLDRTCTEVVECKGTYGIERYVGDYTAYVEEKKKRYAREVKLYEEDQTMRESEEKLISRFRAGSRASFAKSREKMLEKKEEVDKPFTPDTVTFRFDMTREMPTESIFRMEDVFIGRIDPLFFIRSLTLHRRERIGIVGENGVGKSTFLKTILGHVPVLEGIYKKWNNLKIWYYSQMHEGLDIERTVYENFNTPVHTEGLWVDADEVHSDIYSTLHSHLGLDPRSQVSWVHTNENIPSTKGWSSGIYSRERLAGMLGYYGFDFHDMDTRVWNLSGGQRSRLAFAMLGLEETNVLILDEPTNHLDYDTRESLEQSIEKYEWTVLFISHDRYFVNKIASHIWIIENSELCVCHGNYDDYLYKKEHGISYDMSLFDDVAQMNMVLEEQLWPVEAKRLKEKYARKWKKK